MRPPWTSGGRIFALGPRLTIYHEVMPSQFEPPKSSSDQEFQAMAVGMVAGAVPGIIIGLILSFSLGNPAMWVSIVGGIGIIIGLVSAVIYNRSRSRKNRENGTGGESKRD